MSVDETPALTSVDHVARSRRQPVPVRLVRAATIGDGIDQFTPARHLETDELIDRGDAAALAGRVLKFVPASAPGARMFKDLRNAYQGARAPSGTPAGREFFARLDEFPFAAELRRRTGIFHRPGGEEEERLILGALFDDLKLADLPQALVPVHHVERPRTAFEEHILEGTRYTRDEHGLCRLHFAVSAGALSLFSAAFAQLRPQVEAQRRGTTLAVTFSILGQATDVPTVEERGISGDAVAGSVPLPPAGDAALLRNLQDSGGDLVVIKTIDNVLPDEASSEVVRWNRLLIGYLVRLQAEVFALLAALSVRDPASGVLDSASRLVKERFGRRVPEGEGEAVRQALIDALDRPLCVCGVVRHDGEPCGAPFWVRNVAGHESLQIIEPSQIGATDPEQVRMFRSATHGSPMNLVCGLRDHQGRPFELSRFVGSDAEVVTRGRVGEPDVASLGWPGAWSRSTADWNTVCVEIPASTVASVRTVFDLLGPKHQRAHAARAADPEETAITGTVLVIDDQALNQQLLARILERNGLRVRVVGDGDRGIELLEREPIDLVLLDIVMPGLDGYEVLSRLLANPATKDIPVILMSSLDTIADKVRGMELGASDYITKPFDPQEVLARVRAQLRIRSLAATLARSHEQLVQREQRMLEELRAAAEVQKSLLPSVSLSNARMDGGSVFEPSLAIGGDIFNIIPLDGYSALVYMADVSGHGVASALLTMSLAQWLSSFVGARNPAELPSPASMLEALEPEFPFERFGKYFSIVIATIHPVSGVVRYSAAGHPPPLVIRRSGAVERLEAGGPVIGMGFGLTFDEGNCELAPGDRIVFYTDGVVEDLDADGERFGEERLVQHFVSQSQLPLAELCWNLGALLRHRRGDAPAADDIALLAFERR